MINLQNTLLEEVFPRRRLKNNHQLKLGKVVHKIKKLRLLKVVYLL